MAVSKESRRLRIKQSIRRRISGTAQRPRLSVFRSNKGIYAQLIDDVAGITLASASSNKLGKGNGIDASAEVGRQLASKALEKGVSEVIFDRSGYLYHGRIKSLAEGAREGGLKF